MTPRPCNVVPSQSLRTFAVKIQVGQILIWQAPSAISRPGCRGMAQPKPKPSTGTRSSSTKKNSAASIQASRSISIISPSFCDLSGKHEEAEALFRRALDIDERVLGAQNPNVATVLNNLAKVLRDTNRPAEAESLIQPCIGHRSNQLWASASHCGPRSQKSR